MFNYQKGFIENIQQRIIENQHHNLSSNLILLELPNCSKIITIYEENYCQILQSELISVIETKLNLKLFQLDFERYALILGSENSVIIKNTCEEIYKLVQLFHSNDPTRPIHFNALMVSKVINDCNNLSEELKKSFHALKTANFDENNYHYSVEYIEDNKNYFKNDFILAESLKNALLFKKLRLAYQPIINSLNGEVSHYECLLRIVNDEGRVISAGPFIPIAENLNFINLIDELVLEMVVKELINSPNVHLTFNLSALGVYNPNWMLKAKKLLRDPSLTSRLIIEITETSAHKDLRQTVNFVASMQEMGCKVALDDFGAGHTSFKQLKMLPVDVIKIDGCFVRDIIQNTENQIFVKTLIDIIRALGLKSVAEFVENGEIAKLLLDLKVDYMQGNYFCPALNYRSWIEDVL